jgi:hypothetical protein
MFFTAVLFAYLFLLITNYFGEVGDAKPYETLDG